MKIPPLTATKNSTFENNAARLDNKIDNGLQRLDEKIEALSDKVDITSDLRERLAVLEAKVH